MPSFGGVGADAAAFIDDFVDAGGRHAERYGQGIGAHPERGKVVLGRNFAGWKGRMRLTEVSWCSLRGNSQFRRRYAASALNFTPSACTTFMMVANSGLPSADSALYRLSRRRPVSRAS